MNSKEALNHLSFAKLACDLGFYGDAQRHAIDELFIETQPAHLQKGSQQRLATDERDVLRAEIIRSKMASFAPPDLEGVLVREKEARGGAKKEPPHGSGAGEEPSEGNLF
jgi:protein arginine kinase